MKAKKSLGQNFLIDQAIIKNISDSIPAMEKDLIIEIGPGMGALTKYLKQKNSQLICYEIDLDMKRYLSSFEDKKTKIIYQDILLTDIKSTIQNLKYQNLYIVGNLPYYITTPIIKHLINQDLNVSEMIFMVQEEVADRFTAVPKNKEYGSMTLFLKYYYDVKKLFKVSKYAFNPVPKVESAIIKLVKRKESVVVDSEKYFKLINDSFKMKRKTLKNNLSGYDFDKVINVLKKYNLDDKVRAEEISEEVFIDICNSL